MITSYNFFLFVARVSAYIVLVLSSRNSNAIQCKASFDSAEDSGTALVIDVLLQRGPFEKSVSACVSLRSMPTRICSYLRVCHVARRWCIHVGVVSDWWLAWIISEVYHTSRHGCKSVTARCTHQWVVSNTMCTSRVPSKTTTSFHYE